ncbi:MAG: class II aldolase/adducin family protein [Desulfovibrionaceae bacterium]|nr:class II aldolase/adducin family protein [Desulfovibrionaceae bacterium]
MTESRAPSGPRGSRDEGYVKYHCIHTPGPAPAHPDRAALDVLRTALFDAGLLGVRADGVGFGNVSVRGAGDSFVVTATATGGARVLGAEGYCLVTECDVDGNWVRCTGPRQASSEAMSHAAIYRADSSVRCVAHVHSRALFDRLLAAGAPATPPDAAFGTPDMARALAALAAMRTGRARFLVMSGHDEGVMACGSDIPSVAALLGQAARGEISPREA